MILSDIQANAAKVAPGLGVALVVATAATFLSEHYSAPVMLYALLLGVAFNFLTEAERTREGIDFASKGLLRIGVALLGLRIGWSQVAALGWEPVAMIVAMVAITMAVSVVMARAMGFNPLFGFLSGGATAICGASAALALSVALPAHEKKEQATLFTVIGVSAFSTLAMIAYPVIAQWTGLSHHQAGIFIGATIHDVAQVVGAGYAISPDAGDTATIVKLLRVAMLLPVILIAGQITRAAISARNAASAAATLVRRCLRRLHCPQQSCADSRATERSRERRIALVSCHRHCRHRHENAARGDREAWMAADCTDVRRNCVARRNGAGLAEIGLGLTPIAKSLSSNVNNLLPG